MNCNMVSRKVQAEITKNKIYDVAVELINEKEFDDISVSEICEEADVSIGTFYYYFESKQKILFSIYNKADDFFEDEVEPSLKSESTLGKIKEYLNSYIKYIKKDGVEMVKHLYIPDNKLFVKKGRAMKTLLQEIIEEGQKNNEVSNDILPEEAVNYIFVIMRGVVFDWCLYDGEYNIVEYSQKFINNICDYLSVEN